MSEIDHEAAKSDARIFANMGEPEPYSICNLSRAYLDLDAQLAAELARVEALCDVIHDANGVAYPFGDMQKKMDTILEGRDTQGDDA